MNTFKIFAWVLFMSLTSLSLFGQSKEEYMKIMDTQIGEWVLDKESLKVEPPSDRPAPDMKMTFSKDGDKYNRAVFFKTPEGKWVETASEVYEYDADKKWLAFTGTDVREGDFHGQMVLQEDGNIHGVEFNANNQKTSESTLDMRSETETKAKVKSFIYPKNADEDMMVVKFESTWIKQ